MLTRQFDISDIVRNILSGQDNADFIALQQLLAVWSYLVRTGGFQVLEASASVQSRRGSGGGEFFFFQDFDFQVVVFHADDDMAALYQPSEE